MCCFSKRALESCAGRGADIRYFPIWDGASMKRRGRTGAEDRPLTVRGCLSSAIADVYLLLICWWRRRSAWTSWPTGASATMPPATTAATPVKRLVLGILGRGEDCLHLI